MKLPALFWAFFRVGIFGFGGGPSMIPLVHAEVVKRHQWLTDEEFADILAIGNTLPGPIATKMPGYIGYRVGGVAGCAVAVFAISVPMIVAMIAMLGVFSRYRDVAWINGMSHAVIPVVMVMMGQLTWDFLEKSKASLGWIASLLIAAVSGALIYWLGVHPGIIIGAILIAALLKPRRKPKTPSTEESA
ncbi:MULTISPECIES: chromate transporter [unclassified Halomonas]|uniref:chromate transporter n=1 Tax=unclassified Halomonas TaxID=2609666 RepID=UPI0020A0B78E|nr:MULTISPECIES: chromate transporter [unclassified Halomonas]MCP1312842.1 chromate transporter [Halomonas sp. 707D7]MCP1326783.1 chromate transporter [Halomonas sp. 707D4]